jgi:hypothetical protein
LAAIGVNVSASTRCLSSLTVARPVSGIIYASWNSRGAMETLIRRPRFDSSDRPLYTARGDHVHLFDNVIGAPRF